MALATLRLMHPIEQLRYIARSGDVDAASLAVEAAEALADLAREPRALVPACRRLLEFHPSAGPLWWVCAEILAAADPAAAARRSARLLVEDPSAEELAGELPGGARIAAACTPMITEALAARPDLRGALVGGVLALRHGLRAIGGGFNGGADMVGATPDEAPAACAGAVVVLLEPEAAGPSGVLLGSGSSTLARAAVAAGVPLWLVCGVGRILAEPLFAACAARAEDERVLPASAIARVVGPVGAAPGPEALAAGGSGGAVPPELLYRPRP